MNADVVRDRVVKFGRAVSNVFDKSKPDQVWIERMQHRPKFGAGGVVEYMNIMIGIVLRIAAERGIPIYPITSAVWKKHFAQLYGINVKKQPFTTLGQKMTVKAAPGTTRVLKGKTVQVKTQTKFIPGILDDQEQCYMAKLEIHEADAISIACYGWYKNTGLNIINKVLV